MFHVIRQKNLKQFSEASEIQETKTRIVEYGNFKGFQTTKFQEFQLFHSILFTFEKTIRGTCNNKMIQNSLSSR